MQYICTICSKEKKQNVELLPAINRYLAPRIQYSHKFAKERDYRFLILSGEYGFIYPYNLIPNYDHLLLSEEIPYLLPILQKQNEFLSITSLNCIMELRTIPGWDSYYEILEEFAKKEGIEIKFTIYEE